MPPSLGRKVETNLNVLKRLERTQRLTPSTLPFQGPPPEEVGGVIGDTLCAKRALCWLLSMLLFIPSCCDAFLSESTDHFDKELRASC